MIGIYKITSPSKRVYIGQSINIEKRFMSYNGLRCKKQTILYNSFLKYGVEKHNFEILCECEASELNDKERFYQDLYSVVGFNGLNCSLTKSSDRNGEHSEISKLKMSVSSIGINKGAKRSNETKQKISFALKGKKHSPERNAKKSNVSRGKIVSELSKLKMSNSQKGRVFTKETRLKWSKILLDTQTGIFYESVKEVSELFEINYSTLISKLSGKGRNDTNLIYA